MKRRLQFVILFAAVLVLLVFVSRNSLLQWAFKKAAHKVSTKYHLLLGADEVAFRGLDNITIKNLSLTPVNGDTLLFITSAELNLAVAQLFVGAIGFDQVAATEIYLHIVQKKDSNNLPDPHSDNSTAETSSNHPAGFKTKASAYYRQMVRLLRTNISLQQVNITYRDSTATQHISIPHFEYDRQKFSAIVVNHHHADTLDITGTVMQKEKTYLLQAHQRNGRATYLPLLHKEKSFRFGFRDVSCRIAVNESRNQLQLFVDASGKDVIAAHWRLAENEITLPDAGLHAELMIKENSIELDSSSDFRLKSVKAKLYAQYTRDANKTFSCSIHMPETTADSFFHALPDGMFHTLKGITCTGTLAYNLRFAIDSEKPDSLLFYSSLNKKNLRIVKFGNENYSRINAPFDYEAYDKDRFVRTISVGPENPMYTPLNSISDYLVKSVLQSEDPSFMLHRGFLMEAFRESIIKNYKEKRFARGGSTISMQLVKNVFLSRNKTIARKAEEALIVYLIENLGLVSKERMLEIYFNVIEWGPGVYGIGEAAAFYFNKRPSELNLQESIFLAGIIPNPKFFKYQFDKTGHMKSYMSGYFNVLTTRMLSKGWISERDTANLLSSLQLQGRARQLIVPADSIAPEDIDYNE
jgi:hypothetical protein